MSLWPALDQSPGVVQADAELTAARALLAEAEQARDTARVSLDQVRDSIVDGGPTDELGGALDAHRVAAVAVRLRRQGVAAREAARYEALVAAARERLEEVVPIARDRRAIFARLEGTIERLARVRRYRFIDQADIDRPARFVLVTSPPELGSSAIDHARAVRMYADDEIERGHLERAIAAEVAEHAEACEHTRACAELLGRAISVRPVTAEDCFALSLLRSLPQPVTNRNMIRAVLQHFGVARDILMEASSRLPPECAVSDVREQAIVADLAIVLGDNGEALEEFRPRPPPTPWVDPQAGAEQARSTLGWPA